MYYVGWLKVDNVDRKHTTQLTKWNLVRSSEWIQYTNQRWLSFPSWLLLAFHYWQLCLCCPSPMLLRNKNCDWQGKRSIRTEQPPQAGVEAPSRPFRRPSCRQRLHTVLNFAHNTIDRVNRATKTHNVSLCCFWKRPLPVLSLNLIYAYMHANKQLQQTFSMLAICFQSLPSLFPMPTIPIDQLAFYLYHIHIYSSDLGRTHIVECTHIANI